MDPSMSAPAQDNDDRSSENIWQVDRDLPYESPFPGISGLAVQGSAGLASGPDPHLSNPSVSNPYLPPQYPITQAWLPEAFEYNPHFDLHQMQFIMALRQEVNLPWNPVAPTQFYDGGLGFDAFPDSLGPVSNAPVPYAPTEVLEVPSQMTLSRFNELFPAPHDPAHVSAGCSVTDPNVVIGESGRTYHGYKDGAYDLPNDAKTPKHVIDVATGTGIWANSFAMQNPSSSVIGTDLSLIQPDPETTGTPNCEFIRDDAEEEWVFPNITFDYVHIRAVALSFQDPRKVLHNAVKNMSPGGWIEYQDVDSTARSHDRTHEGTGCQRYFNLIQKALEQRGRYPNVVPYYKGWLQEEGLVDINELIFELPANGWPDDPKLKRIGEYLLLDFHDNCHGGGLRLFRSLGMSTEEIDEVVSQFKRDSRNQDNHVFYRFHVVYGRKPHVEKDKAMEL